MIPKSDYHMHTPLCNHAEGEPRLYVEQAIRIGLEEMGFSDHAPLVSHEDLRYTMRRDELSLYHEEIERVRAAYPQIRILTALEADYLPGFEDKTRELLAGYPYDYVIGSVHFIGNWAFDDPEQRSHWENREVEKVYSDYYDLLRRAASSGLYDIMGHVDLVKKFGHRPRRDFSDEIRKTAKVFKDTGVVVELNTSGLRKPVGEIYPSLEVLRFYREAGVPITFSSDAHSPADVGRDFDKAVLHAKEAGYRDYVLFEKRKISGKVSLV